MMLYTGTVREIGDWATALLSGGTPPETGAAAGPAALLWEPGEGALPRSLDRPGPLVVAGAGLPVFIRSGEALPEWVELAARFAGRGVVILAGEGAGDWEAALRERGAADIGRREGFPLLRVPPWAGVVEHIGVLTGCALAGSGTPESFRPWVEASLRALYRKHGVAVPALVWPAVADWGAAQASHWLIVTAEEAAALDVAALSPRDGLPPDRLRRLNATRSAKASLGEWAALLLQANGYARGALNDLAGRVAALAAAGRAGGDFDALPAITVVATGAELFEKTVIEGALVWALAAKRRETCEF